MLHTGVPDADVLAEPHEEHESGQQKRQPQQHLSIDESISTRRSGSYLYAGDRRGVLLTDERFDGTLRSGLACMMPMKRSSELCIATQ
jgi:hypothetical protein